MLNRRVFTSVIPSALAFRTPPSNGSYGPLKQPITWALQSSLVPSLRWFQPFHSFFVSSCLSPSSVRLWPSTRRFPSRSLSRSLPRYWRQWDPPTSLGPPEPCSKPLWRSWSWASVEVCFGGPDRSSLLTHWSKSHGESLLHPFQTEEPHSRWISNVQMWFVCDVEHEHELGSKLGKKWSI